MSQPAAALALEPAEPVPARASAPAEEALSPAPALYSPEWEASMDRLKEHLHEKCPYLSREINDLDNNAIFLRALKASSNRAQEVKQFFDAAGLFRRLLWSDDTLSLVTQTPASARDVMAAFYLSRYVPNSFFYSEKYWTFLAKNIALGLSFFLFNIFYSFASFGNWRAIAGIIFSISLSWILSFLFLKLFFVLFEDFGSHRFSYFRNMLRLANYVYTFTATFILMKRLIGERFVGYSLCFLLLILFDVVLFCGSIYFLAVYCYDFNIFLLSFLYGGAFGVLFVVPALCFEFFGRLSVFDPERTDCIAAAWLSTLGEHYG